MSWRCRSKSLLILQRQLEAARIESEILVIEYNPDPSRPHLYESLQVDEGRYVTVKVITVPPEQHRRFPHWEKNVFHQTCAVNVGLRRSRGRFFVYRAADHIYSDGLIRFLSKKSLLENCIYRCDRYDIGRAGFDASRRAARSRRFQRSARGMLWSGSGVPPWSRRTAFRICTPMPVETSSSWRGFCGCELPVCARRNIPYFWVTTASRCMRLTRGAARVAILPRHCRVYKRNHGLKSVARIQQVWSSRWKRLEQILSLTGSASLMTLFRVIGNYPRRVDRTLEGVLLDSEERHFVLPAFLWAHGFPFIRQNVGAWGLADELLPEVTLASADWEAGALLPAVPRRSERLSGVPEC